MSTCIIILFLLIFSKIKIALWLATFFIALFYNAAIISSMVLLELKVALYFPFLLYKKIVG